MTEGYALIDFTQFYRHLIVCIGDREMLRKCLTEYHDETIASEILSLIDGTEEGKTIYDESRQVFLMWMPRTPKTAQDMGFLSHEVFHAVCAVMSGIGSSLSDNTEEVYAYLITFLTQKILETFSISFSSCQEPESEPTTGENNVWSMEKRSARTLLESNTSISHAAYGYLKALGKFRVNPCAVRLGNVGTIDILHTTFLQSSVQTKTPPFCTREPVFPTGRSVAPDQSATKNPECGNSGLSFQLRRGRW